MEYTVISENSVDRLIDEVNNYIEAGWRPQGGIVFGPAGGELFFLQAMVREEKEGGG